MAPSEFDGMDAEDYLFAHERAREWQEWQAQAAEDPFP